MQMIARLLRDTLLDRIEQTAVVALLGSRQVGKTTLAKSLDFKKPCRYLDLELPSDQAKLSDPELYLSSCKGELVILDEVQTMPDLFPVLRSLVDERRQAGEKTGQFLLLGSASPDILQKSSETLAGRISYLELNPIHLLELEASQEKLDLLWVNGGYPDSHLAKNDSISMQWRNDFITSYVERFLPRLGITATPIELRRFCTMLAHLQGSTLNCTNLSKSLGIDAKTVRKYVELLEGLYLTRSLPPWSRNMGKRLVKAPKVYWRDSGILHALTGLACMEDILGNPLCGSSWEGFCIEQILTSLPARSMASHYRTHAGAELDLVIESSTGETIAVEIKRTLSPKVTPGMMESLKTTKASRGFIVIPRGEGFPLTPNVTACSLRDFLNSMNELE